MAKKPTAKQPNKPTGKPSTVAEYLSLLPPDRRAALEAIRAVILKNLPKGFIEQMQYGMIGYCVPHTLYPHGYHCDPAQPLPFAGLASQKNHMGLYLLCTYIEPDGDRRFREAWQAAGKKLDMGKCCVRFKRLNDVPLDVVASTIARTSLKRFIEIYESGLPDSVREKRAKQAAMPGAANEPIKLPRAKPAPASKKKTAKKSPVKKQPAAAKKKITAKKTAKSSTVKKKKTASKRGTAGSSRTRN